MMLGADSKERCDRYRALFEHEINEQEIELIRSATNQGMVVGNDRFRKEIKVLTGSRVKEKKRGRPMGCLQSVVFLNLFLDRRNTFIGLAPE